MIYVWIGLLIAVLAWREWQILLEWRWKDREDKKTWLPFWETNPNKFKNKFLSGIWKNLDSFHVSNGLATLMFCVVIIGSNLTYQLRFDALSDAVNDAANIIAYWFIWMQIRNLFVKIIYKK